MRQKYPSDITCEQFQHILPILESARKKTSPRTVDLYEVFCAVLYRLKSGCQWRMIPYDFPKGKTVYAYYPIWSEVTGDNPPSVLERALKKNQGGAARIKQGRNAWTSFRIVDAQSVKNTDTAIHKGYDAGKKVCGIKRHIVVDTLGLAHAIAVTPANVTDRAGALEAFTKRKFDLSRVESVRVDGGYSGKPFSDGIKEQSGATVQVAKRNELHTFTVLPQRWIVERSFAWLEKCPRLWKNCERKLNTSLQFTHLAFWVLLMK
ncbi:MAG: IS5 family transposase [Gammaproteobacteria bacterium]|nr:IS5 family transposase [Gammaproteobacteria bacterium]